MKIILCSSSVPFVNGGYRNIVDWLVTMLEQGGHKVERLFIPQVDEPDLLFRQMAAYRWMDLSAADRIICFRPQAHFIPHQHKVLWFIHHLRSYYDLWDSPYRGFPDDAKHRRIRDALHDADTAALRESKKIFTNSQVVSDRLRRFNGVASEVLYPPVFNSQRFFCRQANDEIVCICRLEHHKRQHLLIEALRHTKKPVRLRLCGTSATEGYPTHLKSLVGELGLGDRVRVDNRWISEEEKVEFLAGCLAAAYLPVDEDSYGYPSLEAAHSSKATLTTADSGGVLELIRDGVNGCVAEPNPQALAEAMDRLYTDRSHTQAMGKCAQDRLAELNISWDHTIDRLLA